MRKERKLPGFIIGGAPKSGTSSLYFWLSDHPELCPSPVKETFYWTDNVNRFNRNCNVHEHGIDDYAEHFRHCRAGSLPFEATSSYLYQEQARNGLLNLESKPRMIFLLREPSAQIYSHYRMERYRTKRVNIPLQDYIKLEKNDRHVDYAGHLRSWLELWPRDRIAVYLFEDMMANKVKAIQDICRFLDVDPEFYADYDFEHRNETVAIRVAGLHQLGLKLQRYIPRPIQRTLLPLYMKINSSGVPHKDTEDERIRVELKRRYAHVADELKELYPELPLHLWKT